MTHGGKLIVDTLIALGAKKAFGVPGESYLAVLDGFYGREGQFDFVNCRHESGASFMASAWGKLTGTPGVCFVTRGPGATNASIGVHSAQQDSSPMILMVGDVPRAHRHREAFQEVDFAGMFGPLAKWVATIEDADRIPEYLARAWSLSLSGRPGPVVLLLPEDMLAQTVQVPVPKSTPQLAPDSVTEDTIERLTALLSAAQRPIILAGGPGWTETGRKLVQSFAEQSRIPIVAAFRDNDVVDNRSSAYCGEAGTGMQPHVRKLLDQSDVILALGSRLDEITTWNYRVLPRTDVCLIHVHPSANEMHKVQLAELAIVTHPEIVLEHLAPVRGNWSAWAEEGRSSYLASFNLPQLPGTVDMGEITALVDANIPSETIVTNGAGNFTVWPNKFISYHSGRRLLAPQSGAMGYGLPAGIAAAIASPNKQVIVFAGDGDLQMSLAELAVLKQEGLKLVVLLVNNGIYGTIRAHQETNFPGRVSATSMINPDFVTLAQAYGLHAETVETTASFSAAFARAIASDTGALLDIRVSTEAITARQTITQIREAALQKQGA